MTALLTRPTITDATRREFLAALAAAGLLAGCGSADSAAPPTPDTVEVPHLAGVARVPTDLRRVVTLEARGTMETALALGLPVAAVGVEPGLGLPEFLTAVPGAHSVTPIDVGGDGVDLEQLLALDPDLILTNQSGFETALDKLDAIAPTVVLANSRAEPWQKTLRTLGAALGRGTQATEAVATYESERDAIRARHQNAIDRTTVTTFYAGSTDGVFVYGDLGLFVQTLTDLGGRRPAGQPPEGQDLSLEEIGRIDADLLIRLLFGDGDADLITNPLYQQLPAVRAGRVVEVDGGTANIGGVYAARECLRNLDRAYAAASPA